MEIYGREIFDLKLVFDKEPKRISEDNEYAVIAPHMYL